MSSTKPFFLPLLIMLTYSTNAQVEYETKNISYSYNNSLDCSGYSYSASIPLFKDTSQFFQKIQGEIIGICKDMYSSPGEGFNDLDFSELFEDYNCLDGESSGISFDEYVNSKDTFSFVIRTDWQAGGGGTGMGSSSYCYNINLKDTSIFKFEELFKPEEYPKVEQLIKDSISGRTGEDFEEPNAYASRYSDFLLTHDHIRIFYTWMPSGSRQFVDWFDVPMEGVKLYLKE